MTITIEKGKGKYSPFRTMFQDFKFCIEARGNNDVRYALNYAHVENGQLVCCDGHRLHILDLNKDVYPVDIPDGNYSVKVAKDFIVFEEHKEEGFTYPNWKLVYDNADSGITYKTSINNQGKSFMGAVLAGVIFNSDCKFTLSMDYLEHLDIEGTDWTVSLPSDATGPVRFDNCTKHAVIMPIRM